MSAGTRDGTASHGRSRAYELVVRGDHDRLALKWWRHGRKVRVRALFDVVEESTALLLRVGAWRVCQRSVPVPEYDDVLADLPDGMVAALRREGYEPVDPGFTRPGIPLSEFMGGDKQ